MGELEVELATGGLEVIDQISHEWRELLDRVQAESPYWRPEWISAAVRVNSPGAKIVLITVRQKGQLCAILPLVEEIGEFGRFPVRKLHAPLTALGVGVEIPCSVSGSDRDRAVEAIWKVIEKKRGWDVLELPSVYEGAAIERLCWLGKRDGYATAHWSQPLITFFSIPQGPTAAKDLERYPRHPKLRSKIRQKEAKLAALGSVHLQRKEANGAEGLKHFCEMEAAGWKGREKSALLFNPRRLSFFQEVVQEAEKFGYLCLYSLMLDDRAIAAHIGFTYRGRYWAAKSTYDEGYGDYAPGHLIVKAILRDCSQRGISEYVMGIREDWKLEWTENVRQRSHQCIFNRGLWPGLLYFVHFPLRRRLAVLRRRHIAASSPLKTNEP